MKKHYIISDSGSIIGFTKEDYEMLPKKSRKLFEELGNHFETKKEAKLAVEKLKAWKRLKDKGIKIGKRRHSAYGGEMYWDCPNGTGISDKQIWLDLDLLFGGEE